MRSPTIEEPHTRKIYLFLFRSLRYQVIHILDGSCGLKNAAFLIEAQDYRILNSWQTPTSVKFLHKPGQTQHILENLTADSIPNPSYGLRRFNTQSINWRRDSCGGLLPGVHRQTCSRATRCPNAAGALRILRPRLY